MEIDKTKVKIYLAENCMSQGDLAKKMKMSETHISRILNLKSIVTPGTKTVSKMARALGVSVKDIVKGA